MRFIETNAILKVMSQIMYHWDVEHKIYQNLNYMHIMNSIIN